MQTRFSKHQTPFGGPLAQWATVEPHQDIQVLGGGAGAPAHSLATYTAVAGILKAVLQLVQNCILKIFFLL